jgi:hypothetical protein
MAMQPASTSSKVTTLFLILGASFAGLIGLFYILDSTGAPPDTRSDIDENLSDDDAFDKLLELLKCSRQNKSRLLTLLQSHPGLASRRSAQLGKYPVHLLCSTAAVDVDVLARLAHLFPGGLTAVDCFFAATPLHYLVQSCGSYVQKARSIGVQSGCAVPEQLDALRLLVSSCPTALFHADAAGLLPVHCAVHVHSPCPAALQLLLEACAQHWYMAAPAFPGACCVLEVRTRQGLTPEQLFALHDEVGDSSARRVARAALRALLSPTSRPAIINEPLPQA